VRRMDGRTALALTRRAIRLDRLAVLGLPQAVGGTTPEPLDLFLAERTLERPAASVVDDFAARTAFGLAYEPWITPAWGMLQIRDGLAVPSDAVRLTPRFAEVRLTGALSAIGEVSVEAAPEAGALSLTGTPAVVIAEGARRLSVPPGAMTVTGAAAAVTQQRAERLLTYGLVLPRAQWAAIQIGALSASNGDGYASVGVILRASPPQGSGRGHVAMAAATPNATTTRVGRVEGGSLTWISEVPTPWRVGEWLQCTVEGRWLRVYREGTLVLAVQDSDAILADGRPGLVAATRRETDAAGIAAWMAGPLRQEYVGLVTDMGDVTASLGLLEPSATPARWDIGVSNLGAIGGAARVAALVRHGSARARYDVADAPIRMLVAVQDGLAPIEIMHGRVRGIEAVTRGHLRLVCASLDADVEPRIEGRSVTVLSSPPPFEGPTTLPPDPCTPSPPPDVDVGDEPPEPPPVPSEEGEGPELPFGLSVSGLSVSRRQPSQEAESPSEASSPLPGMWVITMGYRAGGPDEPPYVLLPTTVTAVPLPLGPIPDPAILETRLIQGDSLFEDLPRAKTLTWLYRGPDVTGPDLIGRLIQGDPVEDAGPGFLIQGPELMAITTEYGFAPVPKATFRLVEYDARGIGSVADLQALHPALPDASIPSTLPPALDTLFRFPLARWPADNDTARQDVTRSVGAYMPGRDDISGGVLGYGISLHRFWGPQLLGLEVDSGWTPCAWALRCLLMGVHVLRFGAGVHA
jgi:hypothetical protein